MTTRLDDLALKLVGYVSHLTHGFVLPLFGQYDRANTLYIADCSPSGDHEGTISRFDTYEPVEHAWLPIERPDPVRVGDAWLDVFLWNDQVYVGDARTLWAQLAPIRADLEHLAPLSLFDAAMHAASPERDRLAPVGMKFVTSRFGTNQANQWREGVLRRHVTVLIRRVVPDFQEATTLAEHALSSDNRSVQLKLPRSVLNQLERADALQPLIDDARRLAASFSLDFKLLTSGAGGHTGVTPVVLPPSDVDQRSQKGVAPVLILTIGRRAREIGRHITEPAWTPIDALPVASRSDTAEVSDTSKIIHVIDADDRRFAEKLAPAYEVVALVIDEAIIDRNLSTALRTLLEHTALLGRSVRILVPALPETHPSLLLTDENASEPLMYGWRFHALLDTAQARSPFWWGNPRRSLDRRVADIISTAACLCLSRRFSERARSAPSSEGLMVVAVDLRNERRLPADPQPSLDSESASSEVDQRGTPRRFANFRQSVEVRERDNGTPRRALIEFRPKGDFEAFALAVIKSLFGNDDDQRWRLGEDSNVPGSIRKALRFPRQTFPFQVAAANQIYPVLLTAETPTLDALVAADRAGWRIVRYTDRTTLRAIMRAEGEFNIRNVPGEVALASVATSEVNRKLATRGADTRDIIRLSSDQLHKWLDHMPPGARGDLRSEVRPLWVSSDRSAMGGSQTLAIRRKKLLEVSSNSDRTLQTLGKVLQVNLDEVTVRRPYKRAADLDVCWRLPADGFMRFAIVDGEIPLMIQPLRAGEVVLQSFFIVDGDWSVPALFRSRMFAVWAGATLSRSNSWMSRFSLGATFAGFPVPSLFQIVQTAKSGYVLICEDDEVLGLSKDLEGYFERNANAERRSDWKIAQRSLQLQNLTSAKRLDKLILSAYDLPQNADDLSVLRRLVEMNRKLARPMN